MDEHHSGLGGNEAADRAGDAPLSPDPARAGAGGWARDVEANATANGKANANAGANANASAGANANASAGASSGASAGTNSGARAGRPGPSFIDDHRDLVELLHRRSINMLAFVMVAMGACVAVAAISVWLGLGIVVTVLACWLAANLVFVFATFLAAQICR